MVQEFYFRKLYFVLSSIGSGCYLVKVYNSHDDKINQFKLNDSYSFDYCNELTDFQQFGTTRTATEATRKQAEARRSIYNQHIIYML